MVLFAFSKRRWCNYPLHSLNCCWRISKALLKGTKRGWGRRMFFWVQHQLESEGNTRDSATAVGSCDFLLLYTRLLKGRKDTEWVKLQVKFQKKKKLARTVGYVSLQIVPICPRSGLWVPGFNCFL